MGIVKIRHQGAWNTNHERRNSRNSEVDDKVEEEGLLLGEDSDGAWDHSELAEVDCELAMVGNQICNIPYELYGLSSLNEILALETWNSCLTEEERFYLAAYLPDMDQDTFELTIKELLRGYNLFFGSPLEKFFHGLKGGFYSPQVTCVRNSLQLLHKRGYYYSLRLYHENMAQRFTDMKKTWSNCRPNSTLEERIQIWNNRRDQKPVLLVDLNAFPADEDSLAKCDKIVASVPLLKKTKYTNEGPHTIDLNTVAVNTMTKGKGLLKVRSIEVSSTQTYTVKPLSRDTREPVRRPPKGVLKIKPKFDTFGQLERPITTPIPPENSAPSLLGSHTSRFSPPCSASKWHEENVLPKMPFLYQTVSDRKTYRSSQCPETLSNRYADEPLPLGVGPFESQIFQRKINTVRGTRLDETGHTAGIPKEIFRPKNKPRSRLRSDESCWLGERRNGENVWQNSDQQSSVSCASSAESHEFVRKDHDRLMRPIQPAVSGAARISAVGTAKLRMLPQFSDYSEHWHRDQGDGAFCPKPASKTEPGLEKDLVFPITYKRKKGYTKLNPTESLKQPPMVMKQKSVEPGRADYHPTEKAKSVKIKVKGWSDYNAQCKKDLLNGRQHGSPST